ncbi:hypothetical protein B6N60_04234 [Richelia sinica FACHB-800]|uniref:Uncharacterized protein n=1 Tax=Richelia sinica FACHB-800 TaxID=1357546 RepID=A0A975TB97_9NOST|nr:hypothetical protein B6N60_04234 [Richelia sinica FACHB-800]
MLPENEKSDRTSCHIHQTEIAPQLLYTRKAIAFHHP